MVSKAFIHLHLFLLREESKVEFYPRYEERLLLVERRLNCSHPRVLWGADGETGFCFRCGATIPRKREVD